MTTTKEQLQGLRCKLEAHNLTVCDLRFQSNLVEGAIGSTLVEMESVQRSVDGQLGMVKAFKDLLSTSKAEHFRLLANNTSAWEAWCIALDVLKHQRIALLNQVESMKSGYQCPFLNPSPLPFVNLHSDVCAKFSSILSISPCPCCQWGFEPAWDCI